MVSTKKIGLTMPDHITISKKAFKAIIIAIISSLPIILTSWFLLCDQVEVKAQNQFNKRMDIYYPAKHAQCSTKVACLETIVTTQTADIKEVKESVDLLVMLEKNRLTWKDKQLIIDNLVKNRNMAYDAAYKLLEDNKY